MGGWLRKYCWTFNPRQAVKGTGGGAHGSSGDLQVTRGGRQAAVTQQELNDTYIGAGFQQVRGERVT